MAGKKGAKPKVQPKRKPGRPKKGFEECTIVFEIGLMKLLRDGRAELTLYIPHDSVDQALPLRKTYGLLLEGHLTPVTRESP